MDAERSQFSTQEIPFSWESLSPEKKRKLTQILRQLTKDSGKSTEDQLLEAVIMDKAMRAVARNPRGHVFFEINGDMREMQLT